MCVGLVQRREQLCLLVYYKGENSYVCWSSTKGRTAMCVGLVQSEEQLIMFV
jgi:hypothetical protein